MSKGTILIECPCCGALVGPEKFSKPHRFRVVKRIMAGKIARTEAEKILLKGVKTGRGPATAISGMNYSLTSCMRFTSR